MKRETTAFSGLDLSSLDTGMDCMYGRKGKKEFLTLENDGEADD